MNSIKRFSVRETLYESERTLVYRAWDTEKERPVVVKVFRLGAHSLDEIKRFEHEYEAASRFELHTVVKPYEIVETNSQLAIVYEDFGGITLREYCKGAPLPVSDFLDLAARIVTALADVHLYRIIHRDINPSNILVNRESRQVKITDFGIAMPFQVQHYHSVLTNPGAGSLAYMAPEQAGRMNRPVDYRSDYYSLGITFYEMLTGRVPFHATDTAELLHCHIAREPQPLYEVNSGVPMPLSEIVLKLIEKMPERRYQSTQGILHDLAECRRLYDESGFIRDFGIAARDFTHTFSISNSLIGREREMDVLKNSFDWVRNGHTEMIVVTGASGVGKSTLIRELDRYTAKYSAYFINGSCDRFHKNTPYYCIRAALADLVRQIMAENQSAVEEWKRRLMAALGENIPLLAEFAPEFTAIIGKQDHLDLTDVEREIHYRIMLQRLFSVIAVEKHPLVMTLENIHWIDMAAQSFIHLMMLSREHRYIMIVGSTRTKDLGETHPLRLMIDDINRSGRRIVQQIDLKELSRDEVNQVVAETLRSDPQRTRELADEVFSKTRGNPFFIRELLMSLYDDGVFQFDHAQGSWNWNHLRVREKHFSKNIIDHMAEKIGKMDRDFREPLIFASCIGITFSLEVLTEICRKSREYLLAAMEYAMKEGLIVHDGVNYRFTHERVRHAANIFLSEDQKQVIHRQIGLFLLDKKQNELDQNYFDIVNHMNYAIPLVTDTEEKTLLAQLNSEAGKRAKEAAAYTNSYRYYQTGVKLLGQEAWKYHYDLMYGLHRGAVQAALLSGESALIDTYVDSVMSNSENVEHKADMIDMKIHAYISQGRLEDAVSNALMVLSILDVQILRKRGMQRAGGVWTAFRKRLPKRLGRLSECTMMEEGLNRTKSKILAGTSCAAFRARPELYPQFVLKHLELVLANGNSVHAPQAFAEYGMVLYQHGNTDDGIQLARTALRMCLRERYSFIESRIKAIVYGFIVPWTEGSAFPDIPLVEVYRYCVEQEDFEYAAMTAFVHCTELLFKGTSLSRALRRTGEFSEMVRELNQRSFLPYFSILMQAALISIEATEHPKKFTGEAFNEDEFLETETTVAQRAFLSFIKGIMSLMYGRPEEARYSFLDAKPLREEYGFNVLFHRYDFYYALSVSASCGSFGQNDRRQAQKELSSICRKLKKRAASSEIYRYRYHFIQAEYCRITNRYGQAAFHLENALTIIADMDRAMDYALINVYAGRFYLETRKQSIVRTFMQEAYDTFLRWGASGPAKALRKENPEFIQYVDYAGRDVFHKTVHRTNSTNNKDLDFTAIITASRVLSGEINYNQLIQKLMKIIMEHSGAVRGCLVVQKDGALTLEAESVFHDEIETRVESRCINEKSGTLLPINVINYVSRVHETVVIDDTTAESMFSGDDYFTAGGNRSVLCVPIMHHDALIGLLYLENTLLTGIFSTDRVKLLELICSQAAISIQNSRLYNRLEEYSKTLEEKVRQRTRELEKVNENLMDINSLLREARIEAERDMKMAANVQLSFMPNTYSDDTHWDLAFSYRPMTGVSGDFYDFYEKDGKLIGAGLFDVSGHGISSGLITVIARSIIHRHFLEMEGDPLNTVLEYINDSLIHEIGHTNNYITGVLLRFRGDHVEYVNAAHPSIIKYSRREKRAYEVTQEDDSWRGSFLGMGIMRSSFGMMTVPMEPGDSLVLFSDCLNEGANAARETFGYEGIIRSVEESGAHNASDIQGAISQLYYAHVGRQNLDDDYTVMVIRRK